MASCRCGSNIAPSAAIGSAPKRVSTSCSCLQTSSTPCGEGLGGGPGRAGVAQGALEVVDDARQLRQHALLGLAVELLPVALLALAVVLELRLQPQVALLAGGEIGAQPLELVRGAVPAGRRLGLVPGRARLGKIVGRRRLVIVAAHGRRLPGRAAATRTARTRPLQVHSRLRLRLRLSAAQATIGMIRS